MRAEGEDVSKVVERLADNALIDGVVAEVTAFSGIVDCGGEGGAPFVSIPRSSLVGGDGLRHRTCAWPTRSGILLA